MVGLLPCEEHSFSVTHSSQSLILILCPDILHKSEFLSFKEIVGS